MLLRRIAVENVRSFLKPQELILDGSISIVIGPNGGGKTNLLDIGVTILRRYLFASMYPVHTPTAEQQDRYEFRANDALNNMRLEKHSRGQSLEQVVEVDIEVTEQDCRNMAAMQSKAVEIAAKAKSKYVNLRTERAQNWNLDAIAPGQRYTYRWTGGGVTDIEGPQRHFREYMNDFEIDNLLRAEFDEAALAIPMVYLPVARSANAFSSRVELAGYNDYEQKRTIDATESRGNTSIVPLAIGRLAQKYRLLLEKDTGNARSTFESDDNIKQLTQLLKELGYEWELESTNPLKNAYDIRLRKQGASFLVGAASSGEKELLTYLFAIFALNVRNALIVVDEPELHLHPRWQKVLVTLFVQLAETTGNQFLLATHSPTFISPESIQYVSRVYSVDQQSRIIRLTAAALPEARHLLNIVNSQNNESIFFADEVVLVEGVSDRIFFEAVLDHFGRQKQQQSTIEVISVGGKGLFAAYRQLLDACAVPYSIIADRDYIEQVGSQEIRQLFEVNTDEIKKDVIDNAKSIDGATLFERIEEAMTNGTWGDAQEVWAYIKSRRRRLRTDMSTGDRTKFEGFIAEMRAERVHILSQGVLEDYLPVGNRSKDVGRLIQLISSQGFWTSLPHPARTELERIAKTFIPKSA